MERLTKRNPDGTFSAIDGHNVGELIERLAKFENMYDALTAEQSKIISEMSRLQSEDKRKTVTYQQLLANKMMLANLISRFDLYI